MAEIKTFDIKDYTILTVLTYLGILFAITPGFIIYSTISLLYMREIHKIGANYFGDHNNCLFSLVNF